MEGEVDGLSHLRVLSESNDCCSRSKGSRNISLDESFDLAGR